MGPEGEKGEQPIKVIPIENASGEEQAAAQIFANAGGGFIAQIYLKGCRAEGKSQDSLEQALDTALFNINNKITEKTGEEAMWVQAIDLSETQSTMMGEIKERDEKQKKRVNPKI